MDVTTEQAGGLTVARIAGELDKLTSDAVRAELERRAPVDRLALDLSDVTFLDSAGLHVLFGLFRAYAARGARVAVVVPVECPIRRVVEVSHVEGMVPVCESVDEAAAALARVSP
jgi:anti-anti-sigma factor